MADDVTIGSGATVPVDVPVAADDIAGVKYQRVKLRAADDGSGGSDVSAANPLPVTDAAAEASLATLVGGIPGTKGQKNMAGSLAVVVASDQSALPVSAASLPLPTGAATETTLSTASTSLSSMVTAMGRTAVVTDGSSKDHQEVVTEYLVAGVPQSVDSTHGLPVNIVAGGGGGTQFAEDAAHSSGDLGTMALAVRNDAGTALAGTTGDYIPLSTDSTGNLRVAAHSITDSQKVADNAAFIDGTTPVQPAGFIFDEVAGTALTENDVGSSRMDSKRAQIGVIEDATTRGQRATVSAGGALKVDGSAATQPVSGTVTASNAAGDIAHDAADSGNPVKVGGKARSADITSVAAADRTDLQTDLQGRVIVTPYNQPEANVSGTTGASPITNTTSTAVIAAGGAGIRTYLTQITITNGHATVSTRVDILDGATIMYTVWAQAVGGGASITLPVALRGTANTAWNAQPATTGSSINVSLSGYQSKE